MPDWDTIVWGPVRKVMRTTQLLPAVLVPAAPMACQALAASNRASTLESETPTPGATQTGAAMEPTVAPTKKRRQRLPSSHDRMTGEFSVEPPVWRNDSDQVQVSCPGLRKDLVGVPLVFSPDVRS